MTITHRLPRLHLACAAVAALVLPSCIPEPAYAATPLQLRWTAELSDPKPYNAVLFAGESADLQATLRLYGRSVALEDTATASLYWQTNGMGSAWWSVPATVTTAGVVTASWTPDMDAGADLYRWHIAVANAASSTIYRAFGAFRMQPSPGAAPNAIAPPIRWIDFATIAVSNSPWATPADVAAATSGVLRAESDPVAGAWQAIHLAAANPHGLTPGAIGALPGVVDDGGKAVVGYDIQRGSVDMLADRIRVRSGGTWVDYGINGLLKMAPMQSWWVGFSGAGYYNALDESGWSVTWSDMVLRGEFVETNALFQAELEAKLAAEDLPGFGYAESNWVESVRGVYPDVATNVVYHVVVSNGHWLIQEVQ